jgi:hypothetical protein
MTIGQHDLINRLVQGTHEARAELRDPAWMLLGLLMAAAIVGLILFGVWIRCGGFAKSFEHPPSIGPSDLSDVPPDASHLWS